MVCESTFSIKIYSTATSNLDKGGLYGGNVIWSHRRVVLTFCLDSDVGLGMVRIFAGYTIEQNELVDFLVKEGWGPEHGKPDFTANEVWMAFVSWRSAQPREGDPETLYPWPQCATFAFSLSYVLTFNFSCRLV